MIPYLNPLQKRVWLQATMLCVVCSIIIIGIWFAVDNYLPAEVLWKVVGATTGLLICVSIGKIIADYSLKPTDFLARSVIAATDKKNQTNTPNAESLPAGKQYLSELASNIYDLAGNQRTNADKSNENNKFFGTVANISPLPIFVLNQEQQISFANEAALKYLKQSNEEIIDKPLFDVLNLSFVSDLTLEAWLNKQKDASVSCNEVWERVRLDLKDNERKQFDLAVHYSNNDSSGVEAVLVLFDRTMHYERDDHDLTFVSLAVHELRTPLTIMRGYVEVFADELGDKLDSEQTAFMNNMAASAQQLSTFVTNILNIVRIEQNSLNLKLKEENWKSLLTRACKDMELRSKVHGKKIVLDIDDGLPSVAVDRTTMYEVITNLIENAIKYTHTDEDIIVKSYLKDEQVETTITDKGVGIPENLVGHIFDKFYRAYHSKNSVGGTGLGLYLTRAIVVAHGGTIWVKSKEGKGSTFGFTVPLFSSVADQVKNEDNKEIIRGAHGWIKNHSLYRE